MDKKSGQSGVFLPLFNPMLKKMLRSQISSNKDSKTLILSAITIGGSLEWYEIGIFLFWPLIIEKKAAGFDISLAETLNAGAIVLLVALALANGVARAIGGWFFGKKGDEQGRKIAFPLTLLVATLPSWSLALLSFFISYEYWITYSTVLFALVKFFQGMPAGGELPGAICYLSETASDLKSRRHMCSYSLLGPQIGLGLSAIICLILKAFFPTEFLMRYAWRYVFIFSGLLGIGGYLMRKKIHETAQYLEFKSHHKIVHGVLKILFSKHFSRVVLAFVLSIFEVVAFAVVSILPYYYANPPFSLSGNTILILTLSYSGLCAVLLPIIGFLSSKFMEAPWLKISITGIAIFSCFLFWLILRGEFVFSLICNCILIFFLSIQGAILPSLLAEIFPIQVRYTGIAFSFNICDGILWSAFTGICFLFLTYKNPIFILFLPFAAATFLLGIRMSRAHKKIHSLLK